MASNWRGRNIKAKGCIEEFDFDASKCSKGWKPPEKPIGLHRLFMEKKKETWKERMARMLGAMRNVVCQCSMCSLGYQMCEENGSLFDPHVFSTMNPSKFMVIGQNPGFNECLKGEPFVGAAGKFFDGQLEENGLSRNDFYVTNACKCHTKNNAKPIYEHMRSCEPILRMELMLLKPTLVVTLGAVAFDVFCPDKKMGDWLGKIVLSEKFEVKVYPIYHPSPRNMSVVNRKDKFIKDIGLLCKLVKYLRQR